MSSLTFADMYDEFEAQVATIFTGHKELDDNVLIENNSELKLNKGFCVEWKDADNSERSLNGRSTRQTVIVTNTLKNAGNFTDIVARKKAVKDILEFCHTLVEWVEENPSLNGKACLVTFVNHPGPELIFDREMKAFLMIQATYQLEWF
jgi:hypothetical protein